MKNLIVVNPKDITFHPKNYNKHSDAQVEELARSLDLFDQFKNIVGWRDPGNDTLYVIAGEGLVRAALKRGLSEITVNDRSDLSEDRAMALMLADNLLPSDDFDPKKTAELVRIIDNVEEVPGVTPDWLVEVLGEDEGGGNGQDGGDSGGEVDKAAELQEVWQTELGQIWELGAHRLAVGDCTDEAVVAAVMGGEKATLVHADPPYGMGKEKDGIANDNLYREKLDTFQMSWWKACRSSVEDNASVYIWGNAEDLWRLWYVGGLKDSERLTFRNEIVWLKIYSGMGTPDAMGQRSDIARCYMPSTERCLFFMLGEQGFNINADNYWEGWESIRKYLYDERKKAGWDVPTMKRIVGHSDLLRDHWTSKSQWSFPTREVYQKMQAAARSNDAFKRDYDAFKRDYDDLKRDYDDLKRDYDDLKREFYLTRAYFDNTHDNMTDVWQFQRVQGDERHGHATPKPVEMMERVIKSSCPDGGIVLVPFGGTAPELLACEKQGRKARIVELYPGYCAVILQRYLDATGKTPRLLNG